MTIFHDIDILYLSMFRWKIVNLSPPSNGDIRRQQAVHVSRARQGGEKGKVASVGIHLLGRRRRRSQVAPKMSDIRARGECGEGMSGCASNAEQSLATGAAVKGSASRAMGSRWWQQRRSWACMRRWQRSRLMCEVDGTSRCDTCQVK